jgi:hypothetical protein
MRNLVGYRLQDAIQDYIWVCTCSVSWHRYGQGRGARRHRGCNDAPGVRHDIGAIRILKTTNGGGLCHD